MNFGTIVLLKFPFSDQTSFKKRPALIIHSESDGDILVCRITSKLYTSSLDINVGDWKKAGLQMESVIRVHKLATLERTLIENTLGVLDDEVKTKVKLALLALVEGC
jgi:mRNA interferase MazF